MGVEGEFAGIAGGRPEPLGPSPTPPVARSRSPVRQWQQTVAGFEIAHRLDGC